MRQDPPVNQKQWAMLRRAWESDPLLTFSEIAENIGYTRQGVQQHARRHEWSRLDLSVLDFSKADSKFTELPASRSRQADPVVGDPLENRPTTGSSHPGGEGISLDRVACDRQATGPAADILRRHRSELASIFLDLLRARRKKDLAAVSFLRSAAEVLTIIQKGECRAWGL